MPRRLGSGWRTLISSGDRVRGDSRYLLYRLILTTRVPRTSVLHGIGFTHNTAPPAPAGHPGELTAPDPR